MRASDFHFDLPESLIAQAPLAERSASRLLCLDGASGELAESLERIFGRTRSNEDSATRLREATQALRSQAEGLREDVRKFRT